ncbi:O-linked N-acetylglucosamine transferase family protein [Oceanibaculum pacificum]|uniref:O-GlcNAc transferase C-terminal domain-containing protein n=1 Tax=Oceanibaculum pacificum TaxID=580166 RepID=A0A154VYY2_9PROT|nr:hypothetical protein [Oceanibaculum pacificum]KZD06413.1 hypothetical protein AUP43_10845 [Oceanibaculum pacificum]
MSSRLLLAQRCLDGVALPPGAFDVPPMEDAPLLAEALGRLAAAKTPAARLAPYRAALLLAEPFRLPFLDPLRDLPFAEGRALLPALGRGPAFLRRPGDAAAWAAYAERLLAACGGAALPHLRLHAVFAGPGDLRGLMAARGRLIEQAEGVDEWRPGHRRDGPIRLGILAARIDDRPNTRFLLPHIDGLDRRRYRVHGYVLGGGEDAMAALFRSACDRLVRLDAVPPRARVAALRRDDLDILLVGGNIAAAVDPLCRLAAWRLARRQILLAASPVTSGLSGIDHVLVGGETPPGAEAHYTERLLRLDRLFCCFDPGLQRPPASPALEIEPGAKILLSTANLLKLTPECLDLWLSILAEDDRAVLVLAPFNPYWVGGQPPRDAFAAYLAALARRRGVAPYRVRLVGPFEDAAAADALAVRADLYLDAFPYAGCTTLLAPLAAGTPVVALAGDSQRGNQAAAMLRAAGRSGCVAEDATSYRRIALGLLRQPVRFPPVNSEFPDRMGFAGSLDAALSAMLAGL